MTEGDRPTDDSSPVHEVSDDTDVYPIDFLPPVPPARAVTPAPFPQQPYPTPPGSPYPNTTFGPGYQQPPAAVPPPGYDMRYGTYPARSNGRAGTGRVVRFLTIALFILLMGLVGLIFGLATGIVRYSDLARLIGMGPGEIYVQNLRDDVVTVTVQQMGADGDASAAVHEDQVGPADVRAYPERANGAWDIRFRGADGSDLGTCRLSMSGNDRFTFMVLPEIVVVSSAGQPATSGDDFVVQASPLCRRS